MRRTLVSHLAKAEASKYNLVFYGVVLLILGIATKGFIILTKVQAATPPTENRLQICTEILPSSFDAAGRSNLFWNKKNVLRVGFLDGSPFLKAQVHKYAVTWNPCGNIKFEFSDRGPFDIRVSFTPDGRSWSYIGNDAKSVPENEPTMNFGWFDENTTDVEFRRTILHEFGHALGLIHEHQSPAADIKWNEPAVYNYYWEKFKWSKDRVKENIFKRYEATQTQYTVYDPSSIMHYPIPAEFRIDGVSIALNTNLSPMDIAFVHQIYR
jgi:serralysin